MILRWRCQATQQKIILFSKWFSYIIEVVYVFRWNNVEINLCFPFFVENGRQFGISALGWSKNIWTTSTNNNYLAPLCFQCDLWTHHSQKVELSSEMYIASLESIGFKWISAKLRRTGCSETISRENENWIYNPITLPIHSTGIFDICT